jgi:hypothetical protein
MSNSKMFVPGAALDGLRLALEAENKKLRSDNERLRARVEVLEAVLHAIFPDGANINLVRKANAEEGKP